jgi:hypothetical protein
MASPPPLETAAHLVAHCFREIESAIRGVLAPEKATRPNKHAKRASRGARKAAQSGQRDHVAAIEAILIEYDFDPQSECARIWLRLGSGDDELSLHRHAHRNALQPARTGALPGTAELWEQVLVFLDGTLDRFEAKFVAHVVAAEQLGFVPTPSKAHLKQLRERVPHNDISLSSFFAVAGPAWLPLLVKAGYFSNPPPPEWSADGSSVRFRQWPASRYLAKIATGSLHAEEAALLGEAARAIPDSGNVWVRDDIVAAALAGPIADAIEIGRAARKWLDRGCAVHFPDHVAALGLRLMEAGAVHEGLDVLRPLFVVEPSPYASVHLAATYDDFSFQRVIGTVTSKMLALGQNDAFRVLCDALEAGARGSGKAGADGEGARDDGCAFRSAIEKHHQDKHYLDNPLSLLIDAVRDAAASLATTSAGAEVVVSELDSRSSLVFKRLAMHVVRTCPLVDQRWVQRFVLDEHLLDMSEVWHERRLLERAAFTSLPGPLQDKFFIGVRRHAEKYDQELRRFWLRRQLAMLDEWLPRDLAIEFAEATSESGPPKHPDLLCHSTDSRVDPGPPPGLAKMDPAEVAALVRNSMPAGSGLVERERTQVLLRELTAVVSGDAASYAAIADQFVGGRPRLIWAVLFGFTEAAKKHEAFAWSAVLTLCHWVVAREPEVSENSLDESANGWRWSQKQVADLLVSGMSDDTCTLAESDFDSVVQLTRTLVRLPEGGALSSADDAYSQAVNSLHGAAAETLVHLALWDVRLHHPDDGHREMGVAARSILNELLARRDEGQHLVHAILGRYLPRLFWADCEWVRESLGRILPPGTLGRLAMRTYLRCWRPSAPMLTLLGEQYRDAIRELSSPGFQKRDAATSLIHHLVPLYWWGYLDLHTGLLADFYSHATSAQRAEFLKHVGFCFFHEEDPIDPGVQERARALWESRRRAFVDGEASTEELRVFGWWFASGKFPLEWALAELLWALAAQPDIELAHAVADRLGALVPEHPAEALDGLSLLLSGEDTGWRASACRTGVELALSHARSSAEPAIRQQANELVNRLVAQGNREYLKLAST